MTLWGEWGNFTFDHVIFMQRMVHTPCNSQFIKFAFVYVETLLLK